MERGEESTEFIGDEELFIKIDALIDEWDFEGQPPADTISFAFNLSHWILETYGQQRSSGDTYIFTGFDGFAGEELPDALQPLVMYTYMDELHLQGENEVLIRTKNTYDEHDPFIPKWDELEKLTTFQERLERMRSDPEIRDNIVLPTIEILPGLTISLKPFFTLGWGLEFIVNNRGIQVVPFGDVGRTLPAFNFALENRANTALLAETVCRLALATARYVWYRTDARSSYAKRQPVSTLQILAKRLSGEEQVPIHVGDDYVPKVGNSMKNLLISKLERPS